MNYRKKKIILFGAGEGGYTTYFHLDQRFDVIAFADNDPSKWGTTFLSKSIIAPTDIMQYDFDYIIISNIHGTIIRKQLQEELNIQPEKIIDYFNNLWMDTRVATLRLVANEIYDNSISGSVAEFGVFKGEFAKYINEAFPDRKLYLFDTFSGFDERDVAVDIENNFSNSTVGEFNYSNVESVLEKMIHRDNCIVRKGYFPETANGLDDQFAFVNIDVDLYSPIYEGLKYFFPRMTEGGYIFVHDYNSVRFEGVKHAVKKFCNETNAKLLPLSDLCGSVVIIK
ncbi:TylF/MycF/NovP-related O-methyltransferase [Paenibacillus piri]|uniref:Methyltransferase n=1 Tax=Paenibacillus piri TaxID=2547395 RepID=A0A4R5KFN3_9BACL|nr:TylF/MycF/NovP-related O-methyltransferase [Paenibacillus piri]TDF93505.1 methyltransferase [Paenibacillus piri]